MYRVIGTDAVKGTPLVSVRGRLGRAEKGSFSEIFTGTLYFDIFKFPWDLQKTALQYFAAVDRLSGTRLHEEFLAAFDDDGDGWAGYEESGRKGSSGAALHLAGKSISLQGTDPFGYLKGPFLVKTTLTKCSQESWNLPGHHFCRESFWGSVCLTAYRMSQAQSEYPDPFHPGLFWGKGNGRVSNSPDNVHWASPFSARNSRGLPDFRACMASPSFTPIARRTAASTAVLYTPIQSRRRSAPISPMSQRGGYHRSISFSTSLRAMTASMAGLSRMSSLREIPPSCGRRPSREATRSGRRYRIILQGNPYIYLNKFFCRKKMGSPVPERPNVSQQVDPENLSRFARRLPPGFAPVRTPRPGPGLYVPVGGR